MIEYKKEVEKTEVEKTEVEKTEDVRDSCYCSKSDGRTFDPLFLWDVWLHLKAGKSAYSLRLKRPEEINGLTEMERVLNKLKISPTPDNIYDAALKHINETGKMGIGILSWRDERIKKLKGDFSPTILYYLGNTEILSEITLGFAGSRDASQYGLMSVEKILSRVINKNIVTVSGGARGIDSQCHKSSINNGLKTVCVLGGGILKPYPPENKGLFKKIISSGGLILSEYPPLISPRKYFFPERNRILAGLSDILVVPEASLKSGSLHTAMYMEELGREVITIPHDVTRDTGKGCLFLIQSGSPWLSDYSDINLYLGSDSK